MQKIRIRFKKKDSLKFISHHDLMKLFERAIRRAEIPIRMSEGFNPRPKISFPLALAVGIEGLDEVVEIELNEWMHPSTLLSQLRAQLPQGIEITTVELVSPGESAQAEDVTCRIRLNDMSVPQSKIDELLQRKEITVCREKDGRKRYFNIRPSIMDIVTEQTCPEDGESTVSGADFIELRLKVISEGTARPEEVISALGLDREIDYRLLEITRTKVKLADSNLAHSLEL
ncbi:MAG TPA: TIGR03936 family radical SAM-associated protein [Candidatus Brocadiia bacterium]|nr:DUF2344 domain-containing protein [Planctomycetota bacterium]MDO8091858.1 TIGR03936 family radical SAM-associated protein [Candidatus Brocadiales bacterium]